MRELKIGTRESKLALAQAAQLADYLAAHGVPARLVPMKTSGDVILDRSLAEIGGKGLFVRELDRALLEGRTDVSVHSCKDLPMEVPAQLPLLGFSRRADARDALVLPAGCGEWDRSRPVGCSSPRRMLQLRMLYPDVQFVTMRGNVLTRLAKLDGGACGALVLAAAGLERLGLSGRISRAFEPQEMLPAAGQGILCVQGRAGENYTCLAGFCDAQAGAEALAERAFVRALGGGCTSPIAAYAQARGAELELTGLCCDESGARSCRGSLTGPALEAQALGERLAVQLRGALNGGAQ